MSDDKTSDISAMTDRERILVNIAATLAHEVEYYQRLPAVQEHERQWPGTVRPIRMEWDVLERPKYQKGDLVVCFTSTGCQQNPATGKCPVSAIYPTPESIAAYYAGISLPESQEGNHAESL